MASLIFGLLNLSAYKSDRSSSSSGRCWFWDWTTSRPPSEPVILSMVPWTDHSAPEGWILVPLNETELLLTSSRRAVIPVKPVTTPASKLTINPILVMACACACSSAFIVPSHDSVRTSALTGKQINVKAANSIRDMACSATASNQHIQPITSAYQVQPTRAEHLFDHLVGAGQQAIRHGKSQRLRGLEVDYRLVLCWRLHWQIGRLLALENAIDVTGRAPVLVDVIRSIGDQTTGGDKEAFVVDRRQFVSGR